jgi:hypothetical protein
MNKAEAKKYIGRVCVFHPNQREILIGILSKYYPSSELSPKLSERVDSWMRIRFLEHPLGVYKITCIRSTKYFYMNGRREKEGYYFQTNKNLIVFEEEVKEVTENE